MDTSTLGGRGLEPSPGDVGSESHQTQSKCLVQCHGTGKEKRWRPTILYQLLPPEHVYEKGILPPSKNSGGVGESGRCWTFFVPRPQIGVLANKNGGGIQTIYHLHSRQFGVFLNVITCLLGCATCQPHFRDCCKIVSVS